MKKLALSLAVATAALALQGCEQGSYLNPSTKQMDSDAVARLTATGNDLRVYEFTPQTAPHKQCVFVAGENKGAMDCFDKEPAR